MSDPSSIAADPPIRARSTLSLTVRGRGGHGSAPHVTVDPVVILARLIVRFQAFLAREVAPEDEVTLAVSMVDAGTTHNVIPDDAHALLSLGAVDVDRLHSAAKRLRSIVNAECRASGCESEPEFAHAVEAAPIGAVA